MTDPLESANMTHQTDLSGRNHQPPRKHRLWLWFVVGFAIVFLVMALVWPMHFYDGRTVRQTQLWEYYLLEMRLASNASGNLGPTSGNVSVALGVIATHLVIAAVGGAVSAGMGWLVRKKSSAA